MIRTDATARATCAILFAAGLSIGALHAQSFDNFGSDPFETFNLDDLPEPGEGVTVPSLGGDLEEGETFDFDIGPDSGLIDDGTGGLGDGDITLDTNPDGQSGVTLFTFPGVTGPVTSVIQPATEEARGLTLRALDRSLGRPTDLELTIGQTVMFGRIAIRVNDCRYPVEDPSSDAFAQLQVFDTEGAVLFDGWMIASAPALNALEHPRYDVWVLRCASTS